METSAKPLHLGRKISRLRELRGMKQEALAFELGVSQQTVSRMEASETVADDMLEKVANVLGIPADAIRNFDEDKAIYNIACNFSDNAINNNGLNIQHINPIEKWLAALEENKALYERLLQAEREKVALLEQVLKGK